MASERVEEFTFRVRECLVEWVNRQRKSDVPLLDQQHRRTSTLVMKRVVPDRPLRL